MMRRELIAAGAALPALAPFTAQAATPDLAWLIGEWRGEGSFFGTPSHAELAVAPTLGGRFLELAWRVAAESRPPYDGRGLYRLGGETWPGHWFDSRGDVRPLVATPGAQEVVTEWGTSATERGRSRYARDGDALVVEDGVMGAAGFRVFATHRLGRVTGVL